MLAPAPPAVAETRRLLHRVAETVVSPFHARLTGTEIDLLATPGGFGTPVLEGDRQVRVEGTELVVADNGASRREPIAGADPAAAAYLAALFAFAFDVLDELRAELPASTRPILWPEHFDYAIEAGTPARRATFGISPGDDAHPEPYAYVAPWNPVRGPGWDAVGFTGAEVGLGGGASRVAVLRFFRDRAAAL